MPVWGSRWEGNREPSHLDKQLPSIQALDKGRCKGLAEAILPLEAEREAQGPVPGVGLVDQDERQEERAGRTRYPDW